MLAKTLVLVSRGLRYDSRLLRLHLLRVGLVGVVAAALFFAHLQAATSMVGAPGLDFFSWITWTTLLFTTAAGATFFATCITEEKEEQTLGLLMLANIGPLQLLLGKFLPRLCSALIVLSLVFPFTLLSITLGGVTWSQVWAAFWMLFSHIAFMGGIGLFFSVVCRRSHTAITLTILALALFLIGAPLLGAGLSALGFIPPWLVSIAGFLPRTSAFLRVNSIMATGFAEGAFSLQAISNLVAAALLILLAWALFVVFNRSTEVATERVSVFAPRRSRARAGARPRVWRHAVVWKDFYYVAGGPVGLAVRLALFLGIALVVAILTNDFRFNEQLREAVATTCMLLPLFVAIPLELTLVAARLFTREIKEGTWPNLAGLPATISQIALGKVAGSMLGVLPGLVVLLLGVLLAPDLVARAAFNSGGNTIMAVSSYAYTFAIFVVFLHLTTLFSILFNAWAGVLLAFFVMQLASCFMGPMMFLPAMFLGAVTGSEAGGWIVGVIAMAVYGMGILGICFGLEVLIAGQLRTAAGR